MNLVRDPFKWSASIVSSWFRFATFGAFLVGGLAYTVYSVVTSGWHSAVGPVLMLAFFQLSILYALRRLFLKVSGEDIAADDLATAKWHVIWVGGLFVVAVIVGAVVLGSTRAV